MEIVSSTFIVTGGASGLGAASARMIVAGGGNVVIADLKDADGAALAAELGDAARFVHTDVTHEASGKAAVAAALDAFGGVQGLVNCAGIAPAVKTVGKDGAHPLAVYTKTIMVNLVGSFNMIRLAAEAMSKNDPEATGERGVLISTASVAAYDGQIGQAAYSASKGGIVAMTLPLTRDLASHGIRVMAVCPGTIDTPMVQQASQEIRDYLTEANVFPKRLGSADDIAAVVRTCLETTYLNGEVIRVDAAVRMAPR